jgi:hypothetical protein
VVQLDALGLPRLLEIMQEAYDAQSGMVSGEQIQQGGG